MKRASEKENTPSIWLAKRGKQETFICVILNYRILLTDTTVTLWHHSAIETHETCGDKAPDILKFGLVLRTKRIFTTKRNCLDAPQIHGLCCIIILCIVVPRRYTQRCTVITYLFVSSQPRKISTNWYERNLVCCRIRVTSVIIQHTWITLWKWLYWQTKALSNRHYKYCDSCQKKLTN
jgi:hypothetical protein